MNHILVSSVAFITVLLSALSTKLPGSNSILDPLKCTITLVLPEYPFVLNALPYKYSLNHNFLDLYTAELLLAKPNLPDSPK